MQLQSYLTGYFPKEAMEQADCTFAPGIDAGKQHWKENGGYLGVILNMSIFWVNKVGEKQNLSYS